MDFQPLKRASCFHRLGEKGAAGDTSPTIHVDCNLRAALAVWSLQLSIDLLQRAKPFISETIEPSSTSESIAYYSFPAEIRPSLKIYSLIVIQLTTQKPYKTWSNFEFSLDQLCFLPLPR